MFKTFTTPRNWFRVGEHEYSTNLRYFKEHQITVSHTGYKLKFFSRLDGQLFMEVDMNELPHSFIGTDENQCIAEIHGKLLRGEFGKGIFTD